MAQVRKRSDEDNGTGTEMVVGGTKYRSAKSSKKGKNRYCDLMHKSAVNAGV